MSVKLLKKLMFIPVLNMVVLCISVFQLYKYKIPVFKFMLEGFLWIGFLTIPRLMALYWSNSELTYNITSGVCNHLCFLGLSFLAIRQQEQLIHGQENKNNKNN